jgi:hypothetical protein
MSKTGLIAILLVLTACAVLAYGSVMYRDFKQQLQSYAGLELGDSHEEVRYTFGYPQAVLAAPSPDDILGPPIYYTDRKSHEFNALPQASTIEQFPLWSYYIGQARTEVGFNDTQTVTRIECLGLQDSTARSCPTLLGIRLLDSEARVLQILGTPVDSEVKDGVKTLHYPALGVSLRLRRERVYYLIKEIPKSFSWRALWGYWRHG